MSTRKRKPAKQSVLPESHPPTEGVEWGNQCEKTEQKWFWPGSIPSGACVLLEGRKGTGKSTVAAAIAAAVTGGTDLPLWSGPRDGKVLWFASEDPWEEQVIQRLKAAGACLDRIARARIKYNGGQKRLPLLPTELGWFRETLMAVRPKLVVLDPYVSLCAHGIDLRIEQQARQYLDPLGHLATEIGAVFLLVRHLRKGNSGDVRDAGLGNVAIGNSARSILRCDEHPHERGNFVISVVAGNYGKRMPTQIYQIRDDGNGYPRIEWIGASVLDADSIAEGRGSAAERDEWDDADKLLYLALQAGWVCVENLEKEAEQAGVSPRMLRRAKERLQILSRKSGFGADGIWQWGPPLAGWPDGLAKRALGDTGTHAPGAPLKAPSQKTARKPVKSSKAPKTPRANVCLNNPPENLNGDGQHGEKATAGPEASAEPDNPGASAAADRLEAD